MSELLWLAPWILIGAAVPFSLRRGPRVSDAPPPAPEHAPLVSVILPVRNDALNIGPCIATLLKSSYPHCEIIIVDDESVDGTTEIAEVIAERTTGAVRLIRGAALPEGWFGRPWACWQGYQAARGTLLLFTTADTRHDADLLGHAVGMVQRANADMLTVFPRILFQSPWDRLVLPHLWFLVALQWPLLVRVNRARRPGNAVANAQFMLLRRDAYEAVGGHEAVRSYAVDDLRLAQRVVAAGRRLRLAFAENLMEARLYRSLGELVDAWSKTLAFGLRSAIPRVLRQMVPWIIAALLLLLWVAPPVTLVYSLIFGSGGALRTWAFAATLLSVAFWIAIDIRLRVPLSIAAFYFVGAFPAAWIFIRGALLDAQVLAKRSATRV